MSLRDEYLLMRNAALNADIGPTGGLNAIGFGPQEAVNPALTEPTVPLPTVSPSPELPTEAAPTPQPEIDFSKPYAPDLSAVKEVRDYQEMVAAKQAAKNASLGRRMLEGAKNAASRAFDAPGYLLGKLDATVRHSRTVEAVKNIATERNVKGATIVGLGVAAIGVAAHLVQHKYGHSFDVNIDLPSLGDNNAAPEAPAQAQLESPAPYEGQLFDDTPAEAVTPEPAPTPEPARSFTAEHGDSSWKTAQGSLAAAAENAGVDNDKLSSNSHISKAIKAFTSDDNNEGKFIGEAGLHRKTEYSTGDLDKVTQAMAEEVRAGGDGHLNREQLADALHGPENRPEDDTPKTYLEMEPLTPDTNDGNIPDASWFERLKTNVVRTSGALGATVLAAAGLTGQHLVNKLYRKRMMRALAAGKPVNQKDAVRLEIPLPETLPIPHQVMHASMSTGVSGDLNHLPELEDARR